LLQATIIIVRSANIVSLVYITDHNYEIHLRVSKGFNKAIQHRMSSVYATDSLYDEIQGPYEFRLCNGQSL